MMGVQPINGSGSEYVYRSDFNHISNLMHELSNQLSVTSTKLSMVEKSLDETKASLNDLKENNLELKGKIQGIRLSSNILIGILGLAVTCKELISFFLH